MHIRNILVSSAAALLLLTSVHSANADPIDWCEDSPNLPSCREKGPFDVTQNDYNLGISFSADLDDGRFDFSVKSFVSDNFWQQIRGWTNLAEETNEWEYHRELQEAFDNAERLNLDSTDYLAYAVVYQLNMKVTLDGRQIYINDLDEISGTDWDNNGKIDALEGHPSVKHTISLVEPK